MGLGRILPRYINRLPWYSFSHEQIHRACKRPSIFRPSDSVSDMASKEILASFVEAAICAPSSHNTQPWKFKIEENESAIRIFADGTRRLKLTDPSGRELLISCGAALMNLKVAAEAAGFAVEIKYSELTNVLVNELFELAKATVRKRTLDDSESKYATLGAQIARRVTCRKPFKVDSIPESVMNEITEAIQLEGAWIHIVSNQPNVKKSVCDMILDANDIQWQDASWRDELAAWIKPSSDGDGLHIGPDLFNPITRFFVRWLKFVGDSQGKGDRDLASSAPTLAVLGVGENSPSNWISAGMALEHALLIAAKHDIFASFFNQPLQVKEFDGLRFSDLISYPNGFAVLIFRLGFVANPGATRSTKSSRRPIIDVIM